jgi:hypothetical protein
VNVGAPAAEISRPGVIAGKHPQQVVIDTILAGQIGDIALADLKVEGRLCQALRRMRLIARDIAGRRGHDLHQPTRTDR